MTVTPLDSCEVAAVHPEKVALTREKIPDEAEAGRLAGLFKLLGDPRRARVLYALLEAGELCVLRRRGVVAKRREGLRVYYRLADAHGRMLLDGSREHARHAGQG